MKKISFFFIVALLVHQSFAGSHIAKDSFLHTDSLLVRNTFLFGNDMQIPFVNNGVFNNDIGSNTSSRANLIWPFSSGNPRMSMDYSSGLWIGAKVGPQRDLRTAVAMYNSVFTPGNIPVLGQVPPQSVCDDPAWKPYLVNLIDESLVYGGVRSRTIDTLTFNVVYSSWADWPVDKGAPYVEINGVPGYQPGWNADRPGVGFGNARPSEMCFMSYMDYSNCTNNIHIHESSLPGGTLPMGVEIQQLAYIFNCPGYDRSYFISWKIINKSSNIWDSTFIGLANDADIGDATDDAAGCDSIRQMSFMYNADNYDNIYGAAPPAIGVRLIQGPLVYTGNSNDTVVLPYGAFIGYRMDRLYSVNMFQNVNDPCLGDPDNAIAGYNFLKGLDGCGSPLTNFVTGHRTRFKYSGDACNKTGWFDSSSSDGRTIQSCGPLVINPGDTQTVVVAFVIGRGTSNNQSVCEVLDRSDFIRDAYYGGLCSSVIGIRSISGNVPYMYELYQNYPNPFNPTTKIKFDLAGTGGRRARLIIYDVLGRAVSTLIDSEMKPGSYETDWDSNSFPSGIYFVRLEAGDFSATRKMVLIK